MKFLDTNALMLNKIPSEEFAISSITLKELENIKNSKTKDDDTKYKARQALRSLEAAKHEVVTFQNKMLKPLRKFDFEINDDLKIIACAYYYSKPHFYSKRREVEFITGDKSCYFIAWLILDKVTWIKEIKEDEYCGYKEVMLTENQMCDFYSNLHTNIFNLLVNEYLIIKDALTGEQVDLYMWDGEEHKRIKTKTFFSNYFGEVKPLKDDIYQKMACDSLLRNKLTVLRGPAGTGKSYLGLGYLFSLLDSGKIDKIVMFVNPVAVRHSCKFGFLPGTLTEKILGSQIGNFLSSKLGSMEAVYQLLDNNKLEFIATADARGYDTTGMRCGIYMTESQNTTIDIMKLLLERFGEDTIGVFEGDTDSQVDDIYYENGNNGLRRLCQVFKGEPYFGMVVLKNCYRSQISKKALEM